MGHVAAEFLAQRRCIVRINLRVIASTRDGNVGHAAVEQILGTQFGVPRESRHGRQSVPGWSGWSWHTHRSRCGCLCVIELNHTTTVDLKAQAGQSPVDAFDGPQLAVRNSEVVGRRGELNAVAY